MLLSLKTSKCLYLYCASSLMARLREEVSMQKYIFALLLSTSVIVAGGTARADTIVGFTNRTTFGGNDSAVVLRAV